MIYYAETNLIAIIVGSILLIQGQKISSKNETSQIIMNTMLSLLIVLSVCDILAYYFRGNNYLGVEISNTIYFLAMALGTYAWFLYILVKMGYSSNMIKTYVTTGIPMLALCVSLVLNPVTHFFFTIDEQSLYHRGHGIIISWIVEWGYMLAALGINIRAIIKEERSFRKSEYQGYLVFAIPIAVAAVCQMLFYGTTTTQIGYMIAMLMAYLNKQYYQVQRDDLTGLNNKNAFLNYRDSLTGKSGGIDLTFFMADANKFKQINDVYGHLKGDQALKDFADVLKKSVDRFSQKRLMLYRYGGDEFIILGENLIKEDIEALQERIYENLKQKNYSNKRKGEKYSLSLSIGVAAKLCRSVYDFDELIKAADEAMYSTKRRRKN